MLALLLFLISFTSIFITIKAIYQILTKPFKGSKTTWVLIVMIAFVGPILWLLKGKKLLN
ncbi:hypothetical protein BTO06_16290 [Tenacibaculum sp. SZ-18]|nr:hypothetical protein BTO06_16290 [Tenacibaculum sp. SZ-18]